MDEALLTRREMADMALRAAILPGAALFLAPWLRAADVHEHASTAPPPQPQWLRDYQPRFFPAEDFRALSDFAELLIPSDETPGAREAHCAQYIDFLLHASDAMPQTQQSWRRAIEAVKATGFYAADAPRRLELLTEMSGPETGAIAHHPAFAAYRLIKQGAAFAFYTSRVGMIETLDYKGNSYNTAFPACTHPEHHTV